VRHARITFLFLLLAARESITYFAHSGVGSAVGEHRAGGGQQQRRGNEEFPDRHGGSSLK
jgi:hypothetical protein